MFTIIAVVIVTMVGLEPVERRVPNPYRFFTTEQECKDYADFAHDKFIEVVKRGLPEEADLEVSFECTFRALRDDGSI